MAKRNDTKLKRKIHKIAVFTWQGFRLVSLSALYAQKRFHTVAVKFHGFDTY